MKKLIAMVLCLMTINTMAFADNDKPINVSQLPNNAQKFIEMYFNNVKVSYAKKDSGWINVDYEVVFVNGFKAEFDKNGNWKDVESPKGQEVPKGIVPKEIVTYIETNHSGCKIKDISRDNRDYEVDLNNGIDLKFDLKFNLIEIDS